MADELDTQRSRRALLAAAAGGAAALAATAAMPLTALAATGDDMIVGQANTADATTSLANSTSGSDAFAATASGLGTALKGTSTGTAGVWGVGTDGTGAATAASAAYTGVYGWSPTNPDAFGVGVWGDSEDYGVYGTGVIGTLGDGEIGSLGIGTDVGVLGDGATGVAGFARADASPGVLAVAASPAGIAFQAYGKVRFDRSGRVAVASGKSSVVVTLAGSTKYSKVFAVLATSEASRYVRAAVPAAGKFTVYFNAALRSSAVVSWFVLD